MVMSEIFGTIIALILFFGIPLLIFVWFIVSLVKYIKARREDESYMESRKMALLSLILSSFFILALIALVVLFSMAIAHM